MSDDNQEKMLSEAVVVFLLRRNEHGVEEVSLARKTRKIGAGLWNGYGGGVEPGQTPEEAALDELLQESSVVAVERDLSKVAIAYLTNNSTTGLQVVCKLHIYFLRRWGGSPRETGSKEMVTPTWFPANNLPLDEMLLADRVWLPRVLLGELLEIHATYGPRQKELIGEVVVKAVTGF